MDPVGGIFAKPIFQICAWFCRARACRVGPPPPSPAQHRSTLRRRGGLEGYEEYLEGFSFDDVVKGVFFSRQTTVANVAKQAAPVVLQKVGWRGVARRSSRASALGLPGIIGGRGLGAAPEARPSALMAREPRMTSAAVACSGVTKQSAGQFTPNGTALEARLGSVVGGSCRGRPPKGAAGGSCQCFWAAFSAAPAGRRPGARSAAGAARLGALTSLFGGGKRRYRPAPQPAPSVPENLASRFAALNLGPAGTKEHSGRGPRKTPGFPSARSTNSDRNASPHQASAEAASLRRRWGGAA